MLCEEMGYPDLRPMFEPVRRVNPVSRRLASIERARDELGFVAEVGLREGLQRLIAWYHEVKSDLAVGAK
jgi:UDP-glucose 4-epimerase